MNSKKILKPARQIILPFLKYSSGGGRENCDKTFNRYVVAVTEIILLN